MHASPQVLRLLDNEAINPDDLGDIKVCATERVSWRCADRLAGLG